MPPAPKVTGVPKERAETYWAPIGLPGSTVVPPANVTPPGGENVPDPLSVAPGERAIPLVSVAPVSAPSCAPAATETGPVPSEPDAPAIRTPPFTAVPPP